MVVLSTRVTLIPGVATQLPGELPKEILLAELSDLQDTEETLGFSDSDKKPWAVPHSVVK